MKITVKQEDKNEIPVEILAQSIADIAAGMKRVNASRLNRSALVLLLAHYSGCAQRDVKAVLDGLDNLERTYLKSPVKK